jgi:hypothetical protein
MNKLMKTGITLSTAAVIATGAAVGTAIADGGPSNLNDPGTGPAASTVVAKAAAKKKDRVFAVIRADATKQRARGFQSSTKLGTGVYEVRFDRSIKKCAWTGTVGNGGFSGSTGAAMITITGRAGTSDGLFVTTFNGAGAPADLPFLTTVTCK